MSAMSGYNFYLYADPYLEYAKGGVATLVVPMTALSAVRMPHWSVFCHLVQNAQEATLDEGWVELRLCPDGNWAKIDIEDTGCGMDDGIIREHLFRPFDTAKGNPAWASVGMRARPACVHWPVSSQ